MQGYQPQAAAADTSVDQKSINYRRLDALEEIMEKMSQIAIESGDRCLESDCADEEMSDVFHRASNNYAKLLKAHIEESKYCEDAYGSRGLTKHRIDCLRNYEPPPSFRIYKYRELQKEKARAAAEAEAAAAAQAQEDLATVEAQDNRTVGAETESQAQTSESPSASEACEVTAEQSSVETATAKTEAEPAAAAENSDSYGALPSDPSLHNWVDNVLSSEDRAKGNTKSAPNNDAAVESHNMDDNGHSFMDGFCAAQNNLTNNIKTYDSYP